VKALFDMAWQQRNLGKRYNSASGHALFVGGITRKQAYFIVLVKSKICNFCNAWKKKHPDHATTDPIPPHECRKNHDGTSGSMEAQACLDMAVDLFNEKQCCLLVICIDDDASTGATMKWSNADQYTVPPTAPITKG
jgi:hypothetical protein